MIKRIGRNGRQAVTLNKDHFTVLKAIAKEAECTPAHALKWAIRTLRDLCQTALNVATDRMTI